MLYTYLDNETQLWNFGCKIWGGGSWGNNRYCDLETGFLSKDSAITEMNKYHYDFKNNDYKKEQ